MELELVRLYLRKMVMDAEEIKYYAGYKEYEVDSALSLRSMKDKCLYKAENIAKYTGLNVNAVIRCIGVLKDSVGLIVEISPDGSSITVDNTKWGDCNE